MIRQPIRPDKIAALAPVGGGLAERLMRDCAAAATRPMPLLLIHGTADEINPFDDGELEGNLQYWIRRNGCALSATRTWLPDNAQDDTRTRVETFGGCAQGADVVLYAVEGGGHHWPGGNETLMPATAAKSAISTRPLLFGSSSINIQCLQTECTRRKFISSSFNRSTCVSNTPCGAPS